MGAALAPLIQLLITYAIVRAVAAIGFAVLTYGSVIYALNSAIDQVKTSYNNLPSTVLQFLGLAGVPDFFGIVLGAVVFVIAIRFMKSLVFVGS